MWKLYLRNNYYGQIEEGECRIVSSLNSMFYLMNKNKIEIKKFDTKTKEYSSLCEKGFDLNRTLIELNLEVEKEYKSIFDLTHKKVENNKEMIQYKRKKKIKLPLIMNVWHKIYGRHFICIVDYEPITKSYRIPNFKYVTNLDGWIYEEDLHMYHVRNDSVKLIRLKPK